MKKKKQKHIWKLAAVGALLICLVVSGGLFLKNGLALSDMPEFAAVESVEVFFPEKNASGVLTEAEDISLALSLSKFLRYVPLVGAGKNPSPTVEFTYVLTDGNRLTLSANSGAVRWKGTWRVLKNKETFVRLAEAYFLQEKAETEPTIGETGETEPTLSKEAVDWLIWFQSLSEEEQRAVSYFPEEVRALMGSGGTPGAVEETAPGK